ncbi:cadmium-translocating P-type ATPase [Ancylobacter sp. 6x-1]|uniref:P-type Zn(2+) transporter n=2 Tax=Ancylobacter crimeensis TaxID=2579147 RepID=A0ABT0DC70_9HYPH|nr:cadmium-translocating P-type ATPase [Ancylobacter crimeensis]
MDCASCAAKIDTAVRRIDGVDDVRVSVTAGTMTVRHAGADLALVEKRVTGLGYRIAQMDATSPAAAQPPGPVCGHAHGDTCSGHDHDHHDHGHGHHDHAGDHHAGHTHTHTHTHAHTHAHAHVAAQAEPLSGLHGHDHGLEEGPWWRSAKGRLTIACGVALVAAYGLGRFMPGADLYLFTAAMLVGLIPIARRAIMAALAGTPFSIEMLMTIAAIGAVLIGAGEEGAMVVFLFLVGEMLEGVAAGRARASIRSLSALVPKTARLVEGATTRDIPAESVGVGTVLLVRPGERIPADGEVLEGSSAVNEAPVTGESVPVRRAPGDPVFAGTVNGETALTIRATATASDNTIARVVRLVEEAQEARAPTERFIDRFSRWYTPLVVVLAALVAAVPPLFAGGAWDEWIYKGLAILLIGCPCALVISTPAAVAAALAHGARNGLLIKGGAVLEQLRTITAVCFDKTGTLTLGQPTVTDIVPASQPADEVLRLSAALEAGSTHPLATAILARATADGITLPAVGNAGARGGEGVEGTVEGRTLFLGSPRAAAALAALPEGMDGRIEALNAAGKSIAVLVVEGTVAGLIALRDEPRPDAAAALAELKAHGLRTLMLTGDNARTAQAVGAALGIEVRAELMPADKSRIVHELQAEGLRVAKVGDGINDAPALAAADVGIAMGGGTDVALETADAAILHGRLRDVGAMIALARRTMANIHQNIAIALGLKAVFLVTTIAGITGLWPAILADTGATVLVTANALRLLGGRRAS